MTPRQITAAARTVAHLAGYFAELKAAALALKEAISVDERGYFSPEEDTRTRQLLISYWQSRCALLELVDGLRHDDELPEELHGEAFLPAFAGALLLVDAARFLRDTFGQYKTVRLKLNEPEPHFGIPAGTYDRVQKSLTNPRNAWHLHHATDYFDRNVAMLHEIGSRDELAPCLAVIEQLIDRIRISPARYAKARVAMRASRAVSRIKHGVFGRALYGIQKLGSSMMADLYVKRDHDPGLPPAIHDHLRDVLQPGDVLVVRKEYAVTNYFLPGYWPHAALYLGSADELAAMGVDQHEHVQPRWDKLSSDALPDSRRVLEAMKDGVRIRSIDSPLHSDSIVVIRPQLSQEQIAEALCRGLFHEGKSYDFDFDFARSDRLVCTEVVYRAYDGLGLIQLDLTSRAGRATLSTGDLIVAALETPFFEPIMVYSPAHAEVPLSGEAAEKVLREALGEGVS